MDDDNMGMVTKKDWEDKQIYYQFKKRKKDIDEVIKNSNNNLKYNYQNIKKEYRSLFPEITKYVDVNCKDSKVQKENKKYIENRKKEKKRRIL